MYAFRSALVLSFLLLLTLGGARASAEQLLSTWYDCPFSHDCVASRSFHKGTALHLFNRKTGRSAYAVIRDYGPEAWTGRSLDVSRQIAAELGMTRDGVAWLEVIVIGRR